MSPTPRQGSFFAPAAILAAVLLAYGNSFSCIVLFDDYSNIVDNPSIKNLSGTLENLPFELRPLPTLTIALNYAASGLDVWGYHLFNVAVHSAAALTLFGLVRRTIILRSGEIGADRFAFASALLWALHPIQTESVTYIVQRAQSMMGLGLLATLYALVRSVDTLRPRVWQSFAIAACAAGMACKQDMVVAPIAALAFDRIYIAGSWRGVLRARWLLHLLFFSTWVLLAPSVMFAVDPGGPAPATVEGSAAPLPPPDDRSGVTAGFGLASVTPMQYALTQPGVILHYVGLSFRPEPLCFDYFDWPVVRVWKDTAIPGFVLAASLALTGSLLWLRPALGFLPFFFFLTLAPTSSILPILDVAAERRLYLPLAAETVLAVLAWRALGDGLVARNALEPVVRAKADVVALVVAAVVLGVLTRDRNADYASAVAMWESVVSSRPENSRAHHNLAGALAQAGRRGEAIEHFETACRLKPDAAEHAMLAQTLQEEGRIEAAILHYRKALDLYPTAPGILRGWFDRVHFNLGRVLADTGRWDGAEFHFRQSARIRPDDTLSLVNLGYARVMIGRTEEGVRDLRKAVEADPNSSSAHSNLALALARTGDYDGAIEHFERLLQLEPGNARAIGDWGTVLLKKGDTAGAIERYRQALRLEPANARTAFDLAHAHHVAGDRDIARQIYLNATRADPGRPRGLAAYAWRMATHPDPRRCDTVEAVRLAEQAVEATEGRDPLCLDAVASAYAAAGRFENAKAAAKAALDQHTASDPRAADAARARLRVYERGEAYREAKSP